MTIVPSEETSRFLNVREVAKIAGLPDSTVYDLARRGLIGGVTYFGRAVRFDRLKFEQWLEAGGSK